MPPHPCPHLNPISPIQSELLKYLVVVIVYSDREYARMLSCKKLQIDIRIIVNVPSILQRDRKNILPKNIKKSVYKRTQATKKYFNLLNESAKRIYLHR